MVYYNKKKGKTEYMKMAKAKTWKGMARNESK